MKPMSFRSERVRFWLFFLTVPMCLIIGAVLSVISFFTRELIPCLPIGIGFCVLALLLFVPLGVVLFRRSGSDAESDRKDRFLSDVAHELKTPLTVIRGCAEVMEDGAVAPEQFPEYCAKIRNETEAMSRLVEDLLTVTRMQSGKISLSLRDTDLTDLARRTVQSISVIAAEKGIGLKLNFDPTLPVLLLDPDRIRQLMVIFLDNAVKHTPRGGSVVLSLGRNADRVILTVSDTGSGIAEADLPFVFDRFYQADRSGGGSGIGLSIARQIVRMHKGTVTVRSEVGKGTRFTVSLPLRESKERL